jgi:type II secretory pathway component PulJ
MNGSIRRGVVLLEVLVAMTILAFGCVVVIASMNSIVDSAIHVSDTEKQVVDADQYMTAISLWPRRELDRHLGAHRRGIWMLDVERPAMTIYVVSIMDSTAHHEWLHTALFRPVTPSAQ